jgi:hypothetical protein
MSYAQQLIYPMKITITDKRKIMTIQKEFNTMFPYLKIEFSSRPISNGDASMKKQIKPLSKTLGDCRTIHTSGTITITPNMTVSELGKNFSSVFGLSTEVFRKSGKVWLKTTVTDGWTLKEQNEEGEALSR